MKPPETLWLAAGAIGFLVSWIVGWFRPVPGRYVLVAGIVPLVVALAMRGVTIGYVPLTQRPESIAGFCLCGAIVAVYCDARWLPGIPTAIWRLYRTLILLPIVGLLGWSVIAWPAASPPVPLLVTIWYVIHVPLSFVAYGMWSAGFAAAVARLALASHTGEIDEWDERIRTLVFWGFVLFSISMVIGGIWGYLAWGYVFLWDPKVTLSVALWLAYAALVHLGPRGARARLRAALAIPGWILMWGAFLGTAFFRTSIHGF